MYHHNLLTLWMLDSTFSSSSEERFSEFNFSIKDSVFVISIKIEFWMCPSRCSSVVLTSTITESSSFLWACNQSYEKSLLFLFFFIAESRRDHVATTIPTSWSEKPSVQTHPYPHLQFRYNFRKQLLFPQKLFLVLSQTQSYLCYFKRVESKWDFVNASTAIWHFRNVCWHADKSI